MCSLSKKVQMEIGCDYLVTGNDPNDQHRWSGTIKLATPEESRFRFSPAFAVGLCVRAGRQDGAALDSIPSLGRFSAGYYRGSGRALVNDPAKARAASEGVLVSWDRTMGEISDKLWIGVDNQGGDNVLSSCNFGLSWAFT